MLVWLHGRGICVFTMTPWKLKLQFRLDKQPDLSTTRYNILSWTVFFWFIIYQLNIWCSLSTALLLSDPYEDHVILLSFLIEPKINSTTPLWGNWSYFNMYLLKINSYTITHTQTWLQMCHVLNIEGRKHEKGFWEIGRQHGYCNWNDTCLLKRVKCSPDLPLLLQWRLYQLSRYNQQSHLQMSNLRLCVFQ